MALTFDCKTLLLYMLKKNLLYFIYLKGKTVRKTDDCLNLREKINLLTEKTEFFTEITFLHFGKHAHYLNRV